MNEGINQENLLAAANPQIWHVILKLRLSQIKPVSYRVNIDDNYKYSNDRPS